MLSKPHDVPHQLCLKCGHHFDQASNTTGQRQPKPDDITACIECAHLMAFDQDLNLRELNADESAGIMDVPAVVELVNGIKFINRRKAHGLPDRQ